METIKVKSMVEREITLPAYFQNNESIKRIHKVNGLTRIDRIDVFHDSVSFYNDAMFISSDIDGCVPATEQEFKDALDRVIGEIEKVVNDIEPVQPGSIYRVVTELAPSNPFNPPTDEQS